MANELRLVDANALLEELERYINAPHVKLGGSFSGGMRTAIATCISFLKTQRTVEAVEVVRCRDCVHNDPAKRLRDGGIWCQYWGIEPNADEFCSKGERKDNEKG